MDERANASRIAKNLDRRAAESHDHRSDKGASVNQPREPYKVSRAVLRLPPRPRAASRRVLLSAVIVSCMFLAGGVIPERGIEARALRADDVRTSLIIFGLQVRGIEKS